MPVEIERKNSPFLHYLVRSSHKHIHSWYVQAWRECTSERLLLNPYNGCSVGCFYCYTRSFWGYFQDFHKRRSIFVFSDFDQAVKRDLKKSQIAFCGYLSPVADPLQSINNTYHLTEKTIDVFLQFGLPVNVTTKMYVPPAVISRLAEHPYSYLQISILTLNDKLRRILSPQGADTSVLLRNIERARRKGIFVIARIDPILPYINDVPGELERLIGELGRRGVNHIVASVLDIPTSIYKFVLSKIRLYFGKSIYNKYLKLYKERFSYLNASFFYRRQVFSLLRHLCQQNNLSFALCREFKKEKEKIMGLNAEFATSLNCEGINVPIYFRRQNKFYPLSGCRGNCLTCRDNICGIDKIAYLKSKQPANLTYSDFRHLQVERPVKKENKSFN